MVLITLPDGVVGTEKFLFRIIIMPDSTPFPSMAFDAEVVVALSREITFPSPTFQKSLCQCDACWDMVFNHFLDGEVLIFVDILLKIRIPSDLLGIDGCAAYEKT